MVNRQKESESKKQPTPEVAEDAGREAERRQVNGAVVGDREEARDAQTDNENREMRRRQPSASIEDPANAPEAANPDLAETRAIDAAILH